jgi:hypothetical protein
MKCCIKCGEMKSIQDFYCHPRMADGHLNKCKTCVLAYVHRHRLENIDRIREYDRQRGHSQKNKNRVREYYRKNKEKMLAHSKKWAREHKLERAAHIITGNAIRYGRLKRQPCRGCGSEERVHAHHEDYTRPLDVTWLCQGCHGKRHREINEMERSY